MTVDYLALEVEDYNTRSPVEAAPPERANGGGVSIPALILVLVFFAGFVALAVSLGQMVGAC